MSVDTIPRRARLDLLTPAEKAIFDAVQAVEAMAADVRLTDAVVLLGAARDSVADYLDGVESRRHVRSGTEPEYPRIRTRCPSCGHDTLFVGDGGHLTCSWLKCKEPGVDYAVGRLKADLDAQRLRAGQLGFLVGCVIQALEYFDSDDGHAELIRAGVAAELKRIEGEHESAASQPTAEASTGAERE